MIDHVMEFEPESDEYAEARDRLDKASKVNWSVLESVVVGTGISYATYYEFGTVSDRVRRARR